MNDRPLELHPSALSSAEHPAFNHYWDILSRNDGAIQGGPDHSHSPQQTSTGIDRQIFKAFARERLGNPMSTVDKILSQPFLASSKKLSQSQIFAAFRLFSHSEAMSRSSRSFRPSVDLELVFVPIEPLRIDRHIVTLPESSTSSSSSSESLASDPRGSSRSRLYGRSSPPLLSVSSNSPQRYRSRHSLRSGSESRPSSGNLNGPPSPGVTSKSGGSLAISTTLDKAPRVSHVPSVSIINEGSNNPFRRRLAGQSDDALRQSTPIPHTDSDNRPSLPPRKSAVPSLPSSPRSIDSSMYSSTSTSIPSNLMQQSLSAAERAQEGRQKSDVIIHVIRKSNEPSSGSDNLHSHSKHGNSPDSPSKNHRLSSSDPAPLKNLKLIAHVSHALREAEHTGSVIPPVRKISSGRSGNMDHPTSRYAHISPDTKVWSCGDLLSGRNQKQYAMIILNQPITRKDVFLRAWKSSELRFCADGGANRLFDIWNLEHRSAYLPTMIKGDLDSLRSDVQAYYSSKGVSVKYEGDQNSTDLMKCIAELEAIENASGKKYSLLLFGGLSGRVDQTVHTMSLLHKLRKTRPDSFVLSGESLAWVLDKGSHIIEIDHATMGETCGILPVGVDEAIVKTEGLKWNLDWVTSFDGDMSTSNHLVPSEPVVQVITNRPVLWCIEVKANLPSPSTLLARRSEPLYRPA